MLGINNNFFNPYDYFNEQAIIFLQTTSDTYLKKSQTENVTSGSVLQYQAVAKHVEIFFRLLTATSLHYPLYLGCFIT